MQGQFLLEVESNNSAVITSTATAENASALGPMMAAVSCFGSADESKIERGFILARDPPSYPELVDLTVSVDSNSSVTVLVSWSLLSNFCLNHIDINITTCSSNTLITALRTDSSTTTISHPLPDNQSLIAGVCATVTPVDDRGRTPPATNSSINKNCSCPSTVPPSPTTASNEGGNMALIIGVSIGAFILIVFIVVIAVTIAIAIIIRQHNISESVEINSDTDTDDPAAQTARKKAAAQKLRNFAEELYANADNEEGYAAKVKEVQNVLEESMEQS